LPEDILHMRNPRIIVQQSKTILQAFIAHCYCCGRKHIVIVCNGSLDLTLDDATKLAEDLKKLVLVAKTHP